MSIEDYWGPPKAYATKPRWVLLGSIAVVIVLLLFGLVKIFSPSPIPEEFFLRYQESDSLQKAILTAAKFDFPSLSAANTQRDFVKASQMVDTALSSTLQNGDRSKRLVDVTLALRVVAGRISDTNIREKSLTLLKMLEERNTLIGKIVKNENELFSALRVYYSYMLGNSPPVQLGNVNAIVQQIQTDARDVEQKQTKIDGLFKELLSIANQTPPADYTPLRAIEVGLSSTPEPSPSLPPLPVAQQVQEDTFPVGPVASPTAVLSATDSATASPSAAPDPAETATPTPEQ